MRTYVATVFNHVTGKKYGIVVVRAKDRGRATAWILAHLIEAGFTEPGTVFRPRRLRRGPYSCLMVRP